MKPTPDSTPRPMHHSPLDRRVKDDLEEVELRLSSAEALLTTLHRLELVDDGADGGALDDALDLLSADLLEALHVLDRIRVRRSL